MSQLLYTVEEIFKTGSYLKKSDAYYNIPVYQRGYKWEAKVVTKLLEDIENFIPDGSKFYCLQNITIVPKESSFNVVDGQQRLTTMVVLLSFLGERDLVRNKVRFPEESIREETNRFINELITNDNSELLNDDWDLFISDKPNFDHQDVFYLFSAHKCIKEWFSKKNLLPTFNHEKYLDKLLQNVKFIVNRIDGDNEEEKIFGNLNSKRVPLDGADLVRAILITRVANEEGKREADIKNIVRVNERRVRIGWELDDINNWWSQTNVKGYFKKFTSISSEEISVGNKLFKEDKYPINLLLLLFAEKNGKSVLSLDFIEEKNNNALALYKELIKLHSTLQDWFQDQEIYHYLGYLFSQSKLNFKDVWDDWTANSDSRDSFKTILKGRIKNEIFKENTSINLIDNEVNWYENEQNSLIKILILLDVILSIKKNQPYLSISAFDKKGNDIEHIFPQNPKDIKDKKVFIEFLNEFELEKPDKKILKDFDAKESDPIYQLKLEEFIQKHISKIKINSIGNLVLLDASKNRSIGNNPYSVKRAALIEDINKGIFMRPHTLKVFVRYFDSGKINNYDTPHWTNQDIEANEVAINNNITEFFN